MRPQIGSTQTAAYLMWMGGVAAGVGANGSVLLFAAGAALSVMGMVALRGSKEGRDGA